MRLGSAFAGAKALLSAIELDLFSVLAEKPLAQSEIEARLGLNPRVTWEWLSLLVALGMLERVDGRYRNAPVTELFLDRAKPTYSGGFLERTNQVLYPAWAYLTDALRTGEQQARHVAADDLFDTPYQNPERVEAFLTMMDSLTSAIGPVLARSFDWGQVATVVDVGGARGNLLSFLLREHEHLTGTVFDLAPLRAPAERLAEQRGLTGRLGFAAGSFFDDPIPSADALVIGHVLHDWAPHERQQIVEKAFAAVEPGGTVLVYDCMLADGDLDVARLTISIHMKLMTPGGEEYPVAEGVGMLEKAGFVDVRTQPLGPLDTLVVGTKPR
jgi:hypothetical protein